MHFSGWSINLYATLLIFASAQLFELRWVVEAIHWINLYPVDERSVCLILVSNFIFGG